MTLGMRVAGREDVRTMLDWAHGEGWNPGLDDAEAFLAADPAGFFVAGRDGAPVAAISVVNHSRDFAFLGLYICKPEFRGQGIGFALWKHALDHAGSRSVGLDGVAAQEANYGKSGFARYGATVRLEGQIAPAAGPSIRDFREDDMPAALRLDLRANGYSRVAFLTAWLRPTETRQTVVFSDRSDPAGFATIRRCRTGAKVGPIVAPDADAGMALLRAAADRLPSDPLIVDVPSDNPEFADRLRGLGFTETFATARMYRGTPARPSDQLMAVATMELG